MDGQEPSAHEGEVQYGMDMSLPGAPERWKQILSWVHADLAPDNPEFGVCKAPESWKPQTEEERVEEKFLRRLLLAKTADAIGRACCPPFILKGLVSAEEEEKSGAVELEEAFRRLAKSFNLTDAEAYQAREFADTLNDRTRVLWGAEESIATCAQKFSIIRQAVEAARRMVALQDRKATAEDAAVAAAGKVAKKIRARDRKLAAASAMPKRMASDHEGGHPHASLPVVTFLKRFTVVTCDFDGGRPLLMRRTLKSRVLEIIFKEWATERNRWLSWDVVKRRVGALGNEPEPHRFFEDRKKKRPEYGIVFRQIIEQDKTVNRAGIIYKLRLSPKYTYKAKP